MKIEIIKGKEGHHTDNMIDYEKIIFTSESLEDYFMIKKYFSEYFYEDDNSSAKCSFIMYKNELLMLLLNNLNRAK